MLLDEIKKRMFAAMKSGATVDKEILRVAVGEITTAEARLAEGKKFSDEDIGQILRKLVKSNEETLATGVAPDVEQTLKREIEVIKDLLPKSLDVDEIVSALEPVRAGIAAAAGDGPATGIAMKHLKAQGANVGGKDVSEAVRRIRTA
jgi:uncharacterized protein